MPQLLSAQIIYRDDQGSEIGREYFENQILEGPYFGIPGKSENEKVLVHRMPSGRLESTQAFYEKSDNLKAYEAGKSLLIIYYPGPDDCNTTGARTPKEYYPKSHPALLRWTKKQDAAEPLYIYQIPEGIDRSDPELNWQKDPEKIFEKAFFRYPYPCQSFMVIHPDGRFRGILGEFPLDQIHVALKKTKRGK